jgi:hypothetical protein
MINNRVNRCEFCGLSKEGLAPNCPRRNHLTTGIWLHDTKDQGHGANSGTLANILLASLCFHTMVGY